MLLTAMIAMQKKGQTMQEMIQTRTITEKLNLLPTLQKQTVYEFIDFLLSKNGINNAEGSTRVRDNSSQDKKSLLLNVSVWNEEDIEAIEEAQKDINRWNLTAF